MKVFLTGANGFIASALIPELVKAGHQVIGLTRSADGANSLAKAGAQALHGSLEDLDSLRKGASESNGVIHCAYNNDFSNPEETNKKESNAIEALGSALLGSDRPFLITSVAAMGASAPGQVGVESFYDPNTQNPRKSTENAGAAIADRGGNVSIIRLAQVHNTVKQGFVSRLVQVARDKGVSAYAGDGAVRWAAVHVGDAAHLYRLVLEKQQPGRYNAVGEEGLPVREIAEVIGAGLKVPVKSLSPEEAKAHFGRIAAFVEMDMPASSVQTQQQLGWRPVGPGMISDLKECLRPESLRASS